MEPVGDSEACASGSVSGQQRVHVFGSLGLVLARSGDHSPPALQVFQVPVPRLGTAL